MTKPRLDAIAYIRGVSMLGVIGIHVGSQYLLNPTPNAALTALFEIATRFAVPIFFFISAFGIFYNLDLSQPFSYPQFLRKRLKAVLIPYLVWSIFYVLHDGWLYHVGVPSFGDFLWLLLFGNAKYQLYFLVILLWFYLLMPLWIPLVRHIGVKGLVLLFVLQVAFDYWSSYNTTLNALAYALEPASLRPFLLYRLNYWVFHYIFIFVIGGYLALHMEAFLNFMQRRRVWLITFFWASLLLLLGYYEKLLTGGYNQMEAINTAHQLSPPGILYTLAASLFFFTIFTYQRYPSFLNPILDFCGRHSYFAYLVHPFFIGYMVLYCQHHGIILTAPRALVFYFLTAILSLLAAALCRRLGNLLPPLNFLTIGIWPKKKR